MEALRASQRLQSFKDDAAHRRTLLEDHQPRDKQDEQPRRSRTAAGRVEDTFARRTVQGRAEDAASRGSTAHAIYRTHTVPPWRQAGGKWIVYLVNSHTNAARIDWHLREIDSRFAPGLPLGWS